MSESLSKSQAKRRIVKDGLDSVLRANGFEKCAGSCWVRDTGEVRHVIALVSSYGNYDVQWGVMIEEASEILHDYPPRRGKVGDSTITGGHSAIVRPSAVSYFELEEENSPEVISDIAGRLASDIASVEQYLRPLAKRSDVRRYLLQWEEGEMTPFPFPAALSLRLMVATVIAALDNDPDVSDLLAQTEQKIPRDDLNAERMRKLRALVEKATSVA